VEFQEAMETMGKAVAIAGVVAIVLIRTFLSFSLELEITERWPWQKESRQRLED
jgi:uncharacterized membrane protein